MKKVTVVMISFLIVSLIYSCCKEIRYRTTFAALEYSGKGFVGAENDTIFVSWESPVLLNFTIQNDFTEIAMGSFISSSLAKGGEDCNEYVQEKYEDLIAEMYFACDQDLAEVNANENLPDYHFGLIYRSPNEIIYNERERIIALLNDNTAAANTICLSVSRHKFLTEGKHKFTLRFTTQSGRVFEATTRELVVVF